MKDKRTRLNKREWEARDKRNAAFHEAGHYIAAKHFGLFSFACLYRVPNPTEHERTYRGRTTYQRTTPFREAVIGWSGPIAEYLADSDLETWPDEDLETFEDCHCYEQYSATDEQAMHAHPQRWRAIKTAWRIVVTRRVEVVAAANAMLRKGLAS